MKSLSRAQKVAEISHCGDIIWAYWMLKKVSGRSPHDPEAWFGCFEKMLVPWKSQESLESCIANHRASHWTENQSLKLIFGILDCFCGPIFAPLSWQCLCHTCPRLTHWFGMYNCDAWSTFRPGLHSAEYFLACITENILSLEIFSFMQSGPPSPVK